MLNNTIVCAFFMFFLQINISHANDDVQKIVTYHTPEIGLHYVHALNPKETIYSLSKFSGTSIQEIYDINGIEKTSILSVGQELIIPVQNATIITQKNLTTGAKLSFIKVMYQVKKKDNLFQIAKRYFNTDINTLVKRNNLTGLTISPDQMLHIGWMSFDHSLPVTVNSVVKDSKPQDIQAVIVHESRTKIVTTSPTVQHTEISSAPVSQTAQEVVDNTIQEVNQTEQTGLIQNKYRVVQHTPLPNANKPKTDQPKTEVANSSIDSNQNTIKSPVDTLSVSYSTTATNTAIPQHSTAHEDIPKVTNSTTTAVSKVVKPVKEKVDENIKKRDYPDLSFLSNPNLLTKKGVAMWDKNDNEPLNMFILHHEAKINSYIRIENPMLGRIVLAKVVARLPSNVYDTDVKMVVSSAVANSLGVKDSRFLSEMKYIK